MMQLDNEIIRCLDNLKDIVPFATTSGDINVSYAADMLIRGLVRFHNEKLAIMEEFNRENEDPVARHLSFSEDQGQGPMQLPELVEPPRLRQPIQFAEMDYSDDDDDEPMQLADLMETVESPISQIGTPDHVQYTQGGIDWSDAQPENLQSEEDDTPIHQNITVRPVNRIQCVRKMVYSVDPHKLRELSENDCNVCFEKHLLIDTCVTSCKHHFCKGCFVRWENARRGVVTCPTCRTEGPIVTEYRSRSVV